MSDDRVDMGLVIWRNYNQADAFQDHCLDPSFDPQTMPWAACPPAHRTRTLKETINFSAGSIVTWDTGPSLGPMSGFNNLGQFTGNIVSGITKILLHEFNHGLLGGNNFHLGSGVDDHSVHARQGAHGLLGEDAAVNYSASAWDRNQLGWLHPQKTESISALDNNAVEVRATSTSRHILKE